MPLLFVGLVLVVLAVLADAAQPQGAAGMGQAGPQASDLAQMVGDALTAALGGVWGNGSMVSQTTLDTMAQAIIQQEGSNVPGTRGWRNNNPGNLKPPSGAAGYWPAQTGVDLGGFAVFDSWASGYAALITNLGVHIANNPDQTITDYFASYSPDSTGLSGQYGASVAAALGLSPYATLGSLT